MIVSPGDLTSLLVTAYSLGIATVSLIHIQRDNAMTRLLKEGEAEREGAPHCLTGLYRTPLHTAPSHDSNHAEQDAPQELQIDSRNQGKPE